MTTEPARPAVEQRRCALYRHFDNSEVLLYVGISEGLADRTKRHARTSEWVPFARRAEAEWFATRELAAAAEREAIRREVPIFNRQHAVGDVEQRIANYLQQIETQDAVDTLAAYELMVREFLATLPAAVLAEAEARAEHDYYCAGISADRQFPANVLRHAGDLLATIFAAKPDESRS